MADTATQPITAPTPAPQAPANSMTAQPASAPTEKPVEASTEPKAEDMTEGQKKVFLAFSRKQAAFDLQQKTAKQEREAWETEKATILSKAKDREHYEKLAKEDPQALIKELGFDYKKFTNQMIRAGTKDPQLKEVDALKDRLAKLELDKQQEVVSRTQAEQDQRIQSQIKQIEKYISDNATNYELTHIHGAAKQVWDLQVAHWKKTNQTMPVEKAAAIVEKWAQDEQEERDLNLLKSTKWKEKILSKLAPKDAEKATTAKTEQKKTATLSKTETTLPDKTANKLIGRDELLSRYRGRIN